MDIPEHWNPAKCKMVISIECGGTRVAVNVDKSFPGQWIKEPFHRELYELSTQIASVGGSVVVYDREDAIFVTPKGDINIGKISPGQNIGMKIITMGDDVEYVPFKE